MSCRTIGVALGGVINTREHADMRMKMFAAETLEAAKAMIFAEMGADAVILSERECCLQLCFEHCLQHCLKIRN